MIKSEFTTSQGFKVKLSIGSSIDKILVKGSVSPFLGSFNPVKFEASWEGILSGNVENNISFPGCSFSNIDATRMVHASNEALSLSESYKGKIVDLLNPDTATCCIINDIESGSMDSAFELTLLTAQPLLKLSLGSKYSGRQATQDKGNCVSEAIIRHANNFGQIISAMRDFCNLHKDDAINENNLFQSENASERMKSEKEGIKLACLLVQKSGVSFTGISDFDKVKITLDVCELVIKKKDIQTACELVIQHRNNQTASTEK